MRLSNSNRLNKIPNETCLMQRGSREQPCLTYEIDLYTYCHTQYQGCTHFKPKLSGVSKEEGNGVVTEKGKESVRKIEGS